MPDEKDRTGERIANRADRSVPEQARQRGQERAAAARGGERPASGQDRAAEAHARNAERQAARPENQGQGRAAEAHAARDARQQSRVWQFAGDDEGHPAGDVNKLGKAGPGESRVRPVGGGDEFVVRNDLLTGPDDDDADGSDTPQGGSDPAAGA